MVKKPAIRKEKQGETSDYEGKEIRDVTEALKEGHYKISERKRVEVEGEEKRIEDDKKFVLSKRLIKSSQEMRKH